MKEEPGPVVRDAVTAVFEACDETAPDGLRVASLCSTSRASMAVFELAGGQSGHAIVHLTVDELWFVVSGEGRMWRRDGKMEFITELHTGSCVAIPAGTCFQVQSTGADVLRAVGATTPAWPGDTEAERVQGPWEPSTD